MQRHGKSPQDRRTPPHGSSEAEQSEVSLQSQQRTRSNSAKRKPERREASGANAFYLYPNHKRHQ